jgi:Flp pilus assembly protein TadD
MNNLARVLGDQGKCEQAEEIHRQALRLRETVQSREYPSTLTSMNNLASVLTHRGNYEQAEEIHGQALGLRETALGKENSDALTSMNNLALVLRDQGIYTLTRHYWSQFPFRQPARYFPS